MSTPAASSIVPSFRVTTSPSFDPPFASESLVYDINSSGAMVGGYDTGNPDDSFGFFGSPGSFVPFAFPGFESQTVPFGLNSRNDVVGFYFDPFLSSFAKIGQVYQR